jgi:outer membrane protein
LQALPFVRLTCLCLCILALRAAVTAQDAQPSPSKPLTLAEAVELALKNYPAVRAARAQAEAAGAGVDLARTAYLPRADLLWQQNRATRNNLFGLVLPQSVLPSIPGPALDNPDMDTAWGSAGGLLVNWEPFDFGQRRATVALAQSQSSQAEAAAAVTQLDAATAAADAFLAVVAADQAVRMSQLTVERMRSFAEVVHALVNNQLRAGVEASRADAELATARNQLIQAEQNAAVARAVLAEAVGLAGAEVQVEVGPLLTPPPPAGDAPANFSSHPLALAARAAVDAARAREDVVSRSYFPRFSVLGSVFGRGSGAFVDGRIDNSRGFYPDTMNWAVGVNVTFSAFDIFGLRARRRIEASNFVAEQARYDQTVQALKAQDARTKAMTDAARRIAANTPVQLKAAEETELRARVRYENGLTSVIEVTEAQRLLARAEMEDAVARLNIWRALLAAARVGGDLKPFLQQVAGAAAK